MESMPQFKGFWAKLGARLGTTLRIVLFGSPEA